MGSTVSDTDRMTSEGREKGEESEENGEVKKTTLEVKAEAMVEGNKKEKVPKHRRSWESQDCSCSKVESAHFNAGTDPDSRKF